LWDALDPKTAVSLSAPGSYGVKCLAFDGSGSFLASGYYDKTVRVWEVDARTEVAVLTDGSVKSAAFDLNGSVNSVAFDPRGRYIASGSADAKTRLWDVHTHKQVAVLTGRDVKSEIRQVAFDPSGKYLASGYSHKIILWDILTHHEVAAITELNGLTSLVFDPSGKYLATSEGHCIRVWDFLKLLGVTSRDQLVGLVDGQPNVPCASAMVDSGVSFEWRGSV
jgi:WD40 repeat protein